MDEALSRAWDQLLARPTGSLYLRFILQPLLAVILGVRAGARDAKARTSPYLWGLLTIKGGRKLLLRSAILDVGRLFLMAVLLDCIYQIVEVRWIYPLQALIVGFVLAIVPYVLVRGPVTRIVRRSLARRA